jgi:hypothetical protein
MTISIFMLSNSWSNTVKTLPKKLLPYVFLVTGFLEANAQAVTLQPARIQNAATDSVVKTIDFMYVGGWFAATTPRYQPALFPEGSIGNEFSSRVNCAKISWYMIDPLFYDDNTSYLPPNIKNDPNALSGFYVNQVWGHELFPEFVNPGLPPTNQPVLNLAFYPDEKGLFNFDAAPGKWSAGVEMTGHLRNPPSRWAGIMRRLESPVANSSSVAKRNYKYFDFWLMDPFVESPLNEGGQLYIDMGDISEDILNQGILDAENNDNGYDNMDAVGERTAYKQYLDTIAALFGFGSPAYTKAYGDPSGDDYHYFRGSDYDQQQVSLLDRYKYFNGPEMNSTGNTAEPYCTIGTSIPNTEDINRNNVLDTAEAYYQYKTDLKPSALVTGKNHIIETRTVTTIFPNGVTASVNWYHFRIPVNEPDTIIGNFRDINSAGFMRIFLKGFNTETHLRFATLELVYMQERPRRDMITIYPNPAREFVTIDFDNRTPRSVMLFDQSGRLFLKQNITPGNGQKVSYDLSTLSAGIYSFKIVSDQETVVKKVVIVK